MLISSGPHQQWESSRPRVLFLSHRRLSLYSCGRQRMVPVDQPSRFRPRQSRRVLAALPDQKIQSALADTFFFFYKRTDLTDSYQSCAPDPRTIYVFGLFIQRGVRK